MVLGMYLKYIANSMTDHHGSKCISGTVKLHQNSSSYLPELIKIEEFLRPTRVRRGHMAIAIAKIKPNRGICKFLSTNLWKLKLKLSTLNFSLPPAILVDPPRYRHNFSMAKRRPSFLPVRTRLQRYFFSFGLSVARATIVKNWTAFPCLHSKLKLLAKLGLSEYKVSLLRRNP